MASATDAKKCADLFSKTKSSVDLVTPTRTVVMENLPLDLKRLAIEGLIFHLESPATPESVYVAGPEIIKTLLRLGVAQEDVLSLTSARLEKYIQAGRALGKPLALQGPSPIVFPKLTTSRPRPAIKNPQDDFWDHYDLDRYRLMEENFRTHYANIKPMETYFFSLPWALEMASLVGDRAHAREIILDQLRDGKFADAGRLALDVGDYESVVHIALLTMASVYNQKYSPAVSIELSWAIEYLGQVTGAQQIIAQSILLDFAREMSSPKFRETMLPKAVYYSNSITAENIHSTFEGLILRCTVLGKASPKEITNMIDQMMSDPDQFHFDTVRWALESINDTGRLQRYASQIHQLATDKQRDDLFEMSYSFYMSASDRTNALKLLDTIIYRNRDDLGTLELLILPKLIYRKDKEGLLALLEYISSIDSTSPVFSAKKIEVFINKIQRALANEPIDTPSSATEAAYISDTTLDSVTRYRLLEQHRMKEWQASIRQSLTDEIRTQNIKKGYEHLNSGDLWAAYVSFNDALYREGLIDVIKQMGSTRGESLNISTVILAAALLTPEHQPLLGP